MTTPDSLPLQALAEDNLAWGSPACGRESLGLLPQVDGRGHPWRDHRQVVNGGLWRLRTGAQRSCRAA